ncbi:MAG: segregation/condensation protein A, partial [Candidatus Sumerlaeota bacterium]|nr:segregation/condensation protein A [Candidatus Sumerlaeota bacterium]
LVLAATLIQMKLRALLPETPEAPEEEEGEEITEIMSAKALMEQLIEYRKFKELSVDLNARQEEQMRVFYRSSLLSAMEDARDNAPFRAELGLLFDCFARVLRYVESLPHHDVAFEPFSVEQRVGVFRNRMRMERSFELFALFRECRNKADMIVTFLALLELSRLKEIRLEQGRPYEEVFVYRREAEVSGGPGGMRAPQEVAAESQAHAEIAGGPALIRAPEIQIHDVGPIFEAGQRFIGERELPRGQVAILDDPARAKSALRELFDYAKRRRTGLMERRGLVYRTVSESDAMAYRERGADIHPNAEHLVADSEIRHVLRKHGSKETEKPRGQAPIGREDLAMVPDVVGPENLIRVEKNDRGQTILVYGKRINNDYMIAEEVRVKRGQLALISMRKRVGGSRHAGESMLESPTSPNTPEAFRVAPPPVVTFPDSREEVKGKGKQPRSTATPVANLESEPDAGKSAARLPEPRIIPIEDALRNGQKT